MAKDPAFLFYPGDWHGGTLTFSRHLKGCYMDLLIAQFNSGPLSLEEIKTVLGSDFGSSWPAVRKKFTEKDGLFFNERLVAEIEKRKAYSESRRNNRKKKPENKICETYDEHVISHMENENRNIDALDVFKERSDRFFKPDSSHIDVELTEVETFRVREFMQLMKQVSLNKDQIAGYWKAFKIQYFTGQKPYNSWADIRQHFRNWLKDQRFETVTNNGTLTKGIGDLIKEKRKAS
jgi:hypothetical protein